MALPMGENRYQTDVTLGTIQPAGTSLKFTEAVHAKGSVPRHAEAADPGTYQSERSNTIAA
jgi:hypothetical protein